MAQQYPTYMQDGDMVPDEQMSAVVNVRKETHHASRILRYCVEFAPGPRRQEEPREKILLDCCRTHIHRHNEILAANIRGMAELERWLEEVTAKGDGDEMESRIRSIMDAFTVERT